MGRQSREHAGGDVRGEQERAGACVVAHVLEEAAGADEREHARHREPVDDLEDERTHGHRPDRELRARRAAAERLYPGIAAAAASVISLTLKNAFTGSRRDGGDEQRAVDERPVVDGDEERDRPDREYCGQRDVRTGGGRQHLPPSMAHLQR